MKKIICLLVLSLSLQTMANENKDSDKLSFTKEEFKKAVMDELSKKMKQTGRGNMIDFSKSLIKKEEELKEKELAISKREEQLKLNEKQFVSRVEAFKQEQSKFIACLDEVDKKANDRIAHMVSIVSGMRPQKAADLLSEQEAEISVKIISELDGAKSAKIFNLMDKEISARLQKLYLKMKK